MIFIDSNIPMYLVGAAHPNRDAARLRLEQLFDNQEKLVTDAEVFQEILHRYRHIDRLDAVTPAFRILDEICDETFSIEKQDTYVAHRLLDGHDKISARDALHIAVMRRVGASKIFSFDRGFDGVAGIRRLSSQ
jgi:uncharacterized protein